MRTPVLGMAPVVWITALVLKMKPCGDQTELRKAKKGEKRTRVRTLLFSSLRLSFTVADFDEYLTNSHTFNKL